MVEQEPCVVGPDLRRVAEVGVRGSESLQAVWGVVMGGLEEVQGSNAPSFFELLTVPSLMKTLLGVAWKKSE